MKWLLAFLSAYLLPGVENDPPADDPPADDDLPEDDDPPADDDAPTDDDPPADDPPADDDEPPAPRETRAQKAIRESRDRAQEAERQLATARAELEVARRPASPAQPDPEQALWQQEEDTLRNPDATDWQKYAITANRAARSAQRASQQALAQAHDLADRSAFQALATTKPKLYAAYKDRVEAKVQELRAKGNNIPRDAVLKLMLGDDMLAGKLQPSKEPPKPKTGAAPRRAPASDVPATGRGRLSESEARERRLENIRI